MLCCCMCCDTIAWVDHWVACSLLFNQIVAEVEVAISLDHNRAKAILLDEAAAARRGDRTALSDAWKDRVARLGELCPHGKSATVLAALGTAILAKATDDRVDIYALLDRGEAPDSYSARSLADSVWARHRAELGVDLGANGANPLNNTPFIGKTRVDEITGVRNQEGWAGFMDCMGELKSLSASTKAREALRGFIAARSKSLLPTIKVDPQEGDDVTVSDLISEIDTYVSEDSEGGRRAQACVAAMLDAAFGADHVFVGVINDPDRHAPLDVSVGDNSGQYIVAFEVKDKPVVDYHIRTSVEKTVKDHGLMNLAFVAVSKQQEIGNFNEVVHWAAKRGVKVTIFLSWSSLYHACKCFAPSAEEVFEGKVYRRLLKRGAEIGVDRARLERLRAIAK